VTVVGVDEAHLAGPAAVAVAHDADVLGHGLAGQLAGQPTFIHAVERS
jgi:hypothetical protein